MEALEGGRDIIDEIDVSELNLKQLSQVKQRLDQDLSMLTNSIQALKVAQLKYNSSKESLERVSPDWNGKEILVPLTGSIYVPGKIANPNSVIVDIGTGYFVEKDLQSATDFMKRRVDGVTDHIVKIQNICRKKSAKLEEVKNTMIRVSRQEMGQLAAASAGGPS